MTRYIAFLRAINVGGRTVKMDHLRQLFADLGFAGATTFIASGNVIFASKARNAAGLCGDNTVQKLAAQYASHGEP